MRAGICGSRQVQARACCLLLHLFVAGGACAHSLSIRCSPPPPPTHIHTLSSFTTIVPRSFCCRLALADNASDSTDASSIAGVSCGDALDDWNADNAYMGFSALQREVAARIIAARPATAAEAGGSIPHHCVFVADRADDGATESLIAAVNAMPRASWRVLDLAGCCARHAGSPSGGGDDTASASVIATPDLFGFGGGDSQPPAVDAFSHDALLRVPVRVQVVLAAPVLVKALQREAAETDSGGGGAAVGGGASGAGGGVSGSVAGRSRPHGADELSSRDVASSRSSVTSTSASHSLSALARIPQPSLPQPAAPLTAASRTTSGGGASVSRAASGAAAPQTLPASRKARQQADLAQRAHMASSVKSVKSGAEGDGASRPQLRDDPTLRDRFALAVRDLAARLRPLPAGGKRGVSRAAAEAPRAADASPPTPSTALGDVGGSHSVRRARGGAWATAASNTPADVRRAAGFMSPAGSAQKLLHRHLERRREEAAAAAGGDGGEHDESARIDRLNQFDMSPGLWQSPAARTRHRAATSLSGSARMQLFLQPALAADDEAEAGAVAACAAMAEPLAAVVDLAPESALPSEAAADVVSTLRKRRRTDDDDAGPARDAEAAASAAAAAARSVQLLCVDGRLSKAARRLLLLDADGRLDSEAEPAPAGSSARLVDSDAVLHAVLACSPDTVAWWLTRLSLPPLPLAAAPRRSNSASAVISTSAASAISHEDAAQWRALADAVARALSGAARVQSAAAEGGSVVAPERHTPRRTLRRLVSRMHSDGGAENGGGIGVTTSPRTAAAAADCSLRAKLVAWASARALPPRAIQVLDRLRRSYWALVDPPRALRAGDSTAHDAAAADAALASAIVVVGEPPVPAWAIGDAFTPLRLVTHELPAALALLAAMRMPAAAVNAAAAGGASARLWWPGIAPSIAATAPKAGDGAGELGAAAAAALLRSFLSDVLLLPPAQWDTVPWAPNSAALATTPALTAKHKAPRRRAIRGSTAPRQASESAAGDANRAANVAAAESQKAQPQQRQPSYVRARARTLQALLRLQIAAMAASGSDDADASLDELCVLFRGVSSAVDVPFAVSVGCMPFLLAVAGGGDVTAAAAAGGGSSAPAGGGAGAVVTERTGAAGPSLLWLDAVVGRPYGAVLPALCERLYVENEVTPLVSVVRAAAASMTTPASATVHAVADAAIGAATARSGERRRAAAAAAAAVNALAGAAPAPDAASSDAALRRLSSTADPRQAARAARAKRTASSATAAAANEASASVAPLAASAAPPLPLLPPKKPSAAVKPSRTAVIADLEARIRSAAGATGAATRAATGAAGGSAAGIVSHTTKEAAAIDAPRLAPGKSSTVQAPVPATPSSVTASAVSPLSPPSLGEESSAVALAAALPPRVKRARLATQAFAGLAQAPPAAPCSSISASPSSVAAVAIDQLDERFATPVGPVRAALATSRRDMHDDGDAAARTAAAASAAAASAAATKSSSFLSASPRRGGGDRREVSPQLPALLHAVPSPRLATVPPPTTASTATASGRKSILTGRSPLPLQPTAAALATAAAAAVAAAAPSASASAAAKTLAADASATALNSAAPVLSAAQPLRQFGLGKRSGAGVSAKAAAPPPQRPQSPRLLPAAAAAPMAPAPKPQERREASKARGSGARELSHGVSRASAAHAVHSGGPMLPLAAATTAAVSGGARSRTPPSFPGGDQLIDALRANQDVQRMNRHGGLAFLFQQPVAAQVPEYALLGARSAPPQPLSHMYRRPPGA